MSVHELIQVCFNHGLGGKDIDLCVRGVAGNILKQKLPVVPIEMKEDSKLLHMMKGADNIHIYIDGDTFHFNALYKVVDKFPAVRIYFMRMKDLLQVGRLGAYLEKRGVTLRPVTSDRFAELIEMQNYEQRYLKWRERWDKSNKPFKDLLDGRIQNTIVNKGMWLSTEGSCLICGTKVDRMLTVTLIGRNGIMIGLQLCELHEGEAQESSMLEYVSTKMGVPAAFLSGAKITIHRDQLVLKTCDVVHRELSCEIEKVEGNTITAIRPSGFKVILRQDAIDDYAYIIQNPNGKPISRIDSADHHEVNYGPDHLHRSLTKSKKGIVETSFTFGMVFADVKVIRQLIEDAESQWNVQLSNLTHKKS